MKTLSKQAEQQVIKVATDAIELVEGGMAPDDAMEKLAREARFGPDMVRLACYAYNTGKQNAQREDASTALDKFATFPLMDPQAVIDRLYPAAETAKKASAKLKVAGVSDEYAFPPSWPTARRELEKAASMRNFRKAASATPPVLKPLTPEQTLKNHYQLRKEAEEARTATTTARDQLINKLAEVVEYFRQPDHLRHSFAAVKFAADTYLVGGVSHLMEHVYENSRLKEAKTLPRHAPLVTVNMEERPYAQLRDCVMLGQKLASCIATEETTTQKLEKHAVEKLAPLVSRPKVLKSAAADSLIPIPHRVFYDRECVSHFLPLQSKAAAAVNAPEKWSLLPSKAGGALDDWAGAAAMETARKKLLGSESNSDDKVNDAYLSLDDPAHDSTIRGIQSQALLSELMHDPQISGYDPSEVAHAYNEISQVSPRIATQPLAMRSLLQRHLQGNLGPHEVGQVSDLEKGVKDTAAPVPEVLQALPKPPMMPKKAASDNFLEVVTDGLL